MSDELPRVKRPVKQEPPTPAVPEPETWDELLIAGAAEMRAVQPDRGLQHLLDALRLAEGSKGNARQRCCTLFLLGLLYEDRKQAESARAAFRKACEVWEPGFHTSQEVVTLLKALEVPTFTSEWRLLADRIEWCDLDANLKPLVSPTQALGKPEPPPPPSPPKKKRWPF